MTTILKKKISKGITTISNNFDGILLDAYGVFWNGNDLGVFPGSKESMEKLVLDNKIVGILSNSTQLASKEIAKLERHGLIQGKHFHFLITSGEVARSIFLNEKLPFETPRKKYVLSCGDHPRFSFHAALFNGTIYNETKNIDEADFIYTTPPHINGEDQVDPKIFLEDIKKLKLKNLPMICSNPDEFVYEGNPPKQVVRQGSIALMYEELGGQVFYIGKPHSKAYENAMSHFEKYSITDPAKILMVGDNPKTDIRGAKSFGMNSALITQTGIMADKIRSEGLEKILEDLPFNDCADYFIGRLIDDLHTSH